MNLRYPITFGKGPDMFVPHIAKGNRECSCWAFNVPRVGSHLRSWLGAGSSVFFSRSQKYYHCFCDLLLANFVLPGDFTLEGFFLPSERLQAHTVAFSSHLLVPVKFSHPSIIQFELNKHEVGSYYSFGGIKGWKSENDIVCYWDINNKKVCFNGSWTLFVSNSQR